MMTDEKIIMRWDFLVDLIKRNKYKAVAEVGSAKGRNAAKILEKCRFKKFYLIDNWVYEDEISFSQPEVIKLSMTSKEASEVVPDGSLDLVFIDADHCYECVVEDIRLWLPKIRKGGTICGHDYGNMSGVTRAVGEAFDDFNVQVEKNEWIFVWWKKL